jgi:hypothetical protein
MVYISAHGGTVRFLKGSPDIPEDMGVEMPVIPCVTLLKRGHLFDETIQVELPLRRFDPYKQKERPIIQNPTAMVFSLGYFRTSEIGNRPVNYVRSTMGKALYAYVTPWDQLIVSTAPVPLGGIPAPTVQQRFCTQCGAKQASGNRFCDRCGSKF